MSISLAKNEEQLTNEIMGKISLAKDKENLNKHVVSLSKTVVNLSKKSDVDLGILRAKVVVVMDYSGSMSHLYSNGAVQNTLQRLVPLGLTFDDNGEIDVYLFQNDYKRMKGMNLSNYADYVKTVVNSSGYSMGGTNYAHVLNAIIKGDSKQKRGLFGKIKTVKKSEALVDDGDPTFILFITDGANGDERQTDDILRQCSDKNVFIQFIGIGRDSFSYLQKIDNLDGRVRDNTGFSRLTSLESISDEELYTNVLEEFSNWLKGLQ